MTGGGGDDGGGGGCDGGWDAVSDGVREDGTTTVLTRAVRGGDFSLSWVLLAKGTSTRVTLGPSTLVTLGPSTHVTLGLLRLGVVAISDICTSGVFIGAVTDGASPMEHDTVTRG